MSKPAQTSVLKTALDRTFQCGIFIMVLLAYFLMQMSALILFVQIPLYS
jgi:hypothetical protein